MGQAPHDSAQLDFGPPWDTSTSEIKDTFSDKVSAKAIYRERLLSELYSLSSTLFTQLLKENESIILTLPAVLSLSLY